MDIDTTGYVELGIIQRKKGLKGDLVVLFDRDITQLDALQGLFIQIEHTLVPYRVAQLSLQHHKVIVKLQGVDTPEEAHYLQGRAFFVPEDTLAQLAPKEVYLQQLIGYHVVDNKEGKLGKVATIYSLPQQHLLAVDYLGQKLHIPYHEDIVKQVDDKKKRIAVQLPPGFIEAMR